MSGAKVIGIRGGSSAQGKGSSSKPLPGPLVKLRESVKQKVQGLLRKLFDNADDALFELADKAGSNGDQALYFDAMRELRLQKKLIATGVVKGVIQSFNEIGFYRQDSQRGSDFETDLEELSLVQNDDLEMNVAIEGMVSRLRDNASAALDDLKARTEFLIGSEDLGDDQTPASPETLCESFLEGCNELEVNIRARLVVFKLFEKYVLSEMPQVYAEANQLLIHHGVIPELKKHRQAMRKRHSEARRADRKASSPNVPEENIPTLSPQQMAPGFGGSGQQSGEGQFDDLRQLMHRGDWSGATSEEPPTLSQVYYSQGELVGALSGFQNERIDDLGSLSTNKVINFRDLLDRRLTSGDCSASYSEMDSDVINLVSMLFEFILDDRQLQPTMKALIARLQIPILKVAIMDRNFFNKGGHPARKLLNELASAGIGWNEAVVEGRTDKLKAKIESVVETILKDFDQDISLFSELLEDFQGFMDAEKRRGQLVEQRTRDSEKGKAVNELAKKAVQDYLNRSLKGRSVPECVIELLRDGWSKLMVLNHLKEGAGSEAWEQSCQLVQDLIWSVCPDQTEPDARGKLLQMIPPLIKQLRQGLKDVSFDEFRAKELIKQLESEHIQSLQTLQLNEQNFDTSQVDDDAGVTDQETLEDQDDAVADLVRSTLELEADFNAQVSNNESDQADTESGSRSVSEQTGREESAGSDSVELAQAAGASEQETKTEAAATQDKTTEEIVLVPVESEAASAEIDESDPFVHQVDKFSVGCWFEFDSEGKTERCKLAAVIKATGKYIFVNRSGIKVAEKTRMGLAVELKRGSLQILNDGLLFDRALESIITNLRGKGKDTV